MNDDREISITANLHDEATEKLIREFAAKHDFNIESLRKLIRTNPLLGAAQVLAKLEEKINRGLVLCDSKAHPTPRAKRRRDFAATGRRSLPVRSGGKLRTARDRDRAQKALKDYRRREDAAAKRKAG